MSCPDCGQDGVPGIYCGFDFRGPCQTCSPEAGQDLSPVSGSCTVHIDGVALPDPGGTIKLELNSDAHRGRMFEPVIGRTSFDLVELGPGCLRPTKEEVIDRLKRTIRKCDAAFPPPALHILGGAPINEMFPAPLVSIARELGIAEANWRGSDWLIPLAKEPESGATPMGVHLSDSCEHLQRVDGRLEYVSIQTSSVPLIVIDAVIRAWVGLGGEC